MSDPYVVIVASQGAPHDADFETEVMCYQFEGPDAAREFFENAVVMAEAADEQIIIQVMEPEPITFAVSTAEALEDFANFLAGH